jgi:starch synthase
MVRDQCKPIVACVGRLDGQKGVHLIHHAIFYALAHDAQFVLLGSSPDPEISRHFGHLKQHLNDHPDVHLELRFSPELAHLVYAGSDMLVMPSMFEPCGLAQQIALRYGTVPTVRAVGWLAGWQTRSLTATTPAIRPSGVPDLSLSTSTTAGSSPRSRARSDSGTDPPPGFRELMLNGMRSDRSWARPGQDYLKIYEKIKD